MIDHVAYRIQMPQFLEMYTEMSCFDVFIPVISPWLDWLYGLY